MIGVAIIGAGAIADAHIEAYGRFAGRCEVRAIADTFAEAAVKKAEKHGLRCQTVSDYRELLERDDIDLVSVCLPPALHCEVSSAFLSAGKHVLCEKPMAPTLEECDRMLAAAKKGGAVLSIVAQNRFKNVIMKTKKLLESGVLGAPLYSQVNSLWWRGGNYYDLCWRGTWEREGGGCTFSHAVHHVDLMLWFMGNVSEVSAIAANQAHFNSEVEDVAISSIRFENGAVGSLITSILHHGEEQKIFVDCERASVEIPHKISASTQKPNGFPVEDAALERELEEKFAELPELSCTDHAGQIDDVLKAIENGSEPLVTGEEGRRSVEFITALYQSAFTGTAVRLPVTKKDLFYSKAGILSRTVKFHEKTKSVERLEESGISIGGSL